MTLYPRVQFFFANPVEAKKIKNLSSRNKKNSGGTSQTCQILTLQCKLYSYFVFIFGKHF